MNLKCEQVKVSVAMFILQSSGSQQFLTSAQEKFVEQLIGRFLSRQLIPKNSRKESF